MKNGFTLIETILYITLLSLIIFGIFSSLFSYLHMALYKPVFSEEDYNQLIKDFHEE